MTSEVSGNIIDLCPVGALNSRPYEYKARTWELKKAESIDALDAVGSNIRVDCRGPEVMRILPRLNEAVNEEWISDKTRFSYDGLTKRRLDVPMVKAGGKLQPSTWAEAFAAVRERVKGLDPAKVAFIVGDMVDAETMVMVKELAARIGTRNLDCRQDGAKLDPAGRAGWLFNTTIAGIEQADACLLIGTNPRWEAPLVAARLRKRWTRGGFKVARIGVPFDQTYPVAELGAGAATLTEMVEGRHEWSDTLGGAKRPMLILGTGAIARDDGAAVLAQARDLAERHGMIGEDWNGFNILHTAAARVAGMELGLVPGEGGRDVAGILDGTGRGEIEVVFLIGADELDTGRLGDAFVVYQGSHGDRGATAADVVLPGSAYTEKNATWVNLEGRPQRGKLAVFAPGEAKEDWKILRALSEALGVKVPLDTLAAVRARMVELVPHLGAINEVTPAAWGPFGTPGPVDRAPFASPITDFYLTNPISRASAVMRECSRVFAGGQDLRATGTHG